MFTVQPVKFPFPYFKRTYTTTSETTTRTQWGRRGRGWWGGELETKATNRENSSRLTPQLRSPLETNNAEGCVGGGGGVSRLL